MHGKNVNKDDMDHCIERFQLVTFALVSWLSEVQDTRLETHIPSHAKAAESMKAKLIIPVSGRLLDCFDKPNIHL